MSTSTSRGRTSKIRPLTIEPSRKSGIGFDITSCICTIIKKGLLGAQRRSYRTSIFSVQLKHRKTERQSRRFRAIGQTLIPGGEDVVERSDYWLGGNPVGGLPFVPRPSHFHRGTAGAGIA